MDQSKLLTQELYNTGMAVAMKITRNLEDTEDIVQTSVLKALKSDGPNEIDSYSAWFLVIVRNTALNKKTRRREYPAEDFPELTSEVNYELRDCLKRLDNESIATLVQHKLYGLSIRACMNESGYAYSTVKLKRKEALEKLRRLYEKV